MRGVFHTGLSSTSSFHLGKVVDLFRALLLTDIIGGGW